MFEDVSRRPVRRIHFIGLGGIGMSGLALVLRRYGYAISGSDLKASPITDKLRDMGVRFTVGHRAEAVDGADLVIYTAAVRPGNPELARAAELGLPVLTRAELLGLLMSRVDWGVAVAGTHGKTTTTAMVGVILERSGLDPTVLVGGEVEELGGNARVGDSPYFVAEACEFNGSFLALRPRVAAILNIDDDHLDYFKSLSNVAAAFRRFAETVRPDGAVILNHDDPRVIGIGPSVKAEVVSYAIDGAARWRATGIDFGGTPYASFKAVLDGRPVARVELKVPGRHNVSNALAALAVGARLGVVPQTAAEALGDFRGAHRRFEAKGARGGVTVYDDYAHHPTAIRSTLEAARRLEANRLWCVFQPHLYSRTRDLMGAFARELTAADRLVITDIYAAREEDPGDVSSRDLARLIAENGAEVEYLPDFDQIVDFLKRETRPGDVVMTMGAGDVYRVAEKFVEG
ncbi:MAG TPA: UDP-N-acetylmuramate--L-alanine ligase [Bacillota bacterium]|jgi:UDP-N-acetylmuramate--alanine ligase